MTEPTSGVTPAAAPVETELKLLVPAAVVSRLARHPLLASGGRPRRLRLHSVYFDTPALDLWKQGIALRVRREGQRWIQAVKGRGTAQGGLHRRSESESPVARGRPEPGRIADRELARIFRRPRLRSRLEPVFTTDFLRESRLIEVNAGTRIEASLDQGVIRAHGRQEPVCELELELKSGDARHLYEVALKLAEHLPLCVSDRSKAERGYALARGAPQAPTKSPPARLDRSMSVGTAFRAVMWANLAHLRAHEPGMLDGRDPEYLHQVRVALRRLRSALGVFGPLLPGPALSFIESELKWLAASLGPARDWDVFVTETLPPIRAACGAEDGLSPLIARCRRLRREAAAQARRAARSARHHRLLLRLAAWLESGDWLTHANSATRAGLDAPVTRFAAAVLDRYRERVRKAGRGLESLSPRELHRLRIAIKKLRYAADFFAGLYPRARVRAALKRLSRLQDILGAMNDAATVAQRVAHDGAGRRAVAARRAVLKWSRGRIAQLKQELGRAWKDFRSAEKFW